MPAPDYVYVSAFLCKMLLREGHVFSAIRIIDTFTWNVSSAPETDAKSVPAIEATLFVLLKSDRPYSGVAKIALVTPDGDEHEPREFKVVLKGPPHGHSISLEIRLAVGVQEGLYWFHVYWDDDLVHRVPMRVQTQAGPRSESDPQSLQTPEK